MYATLRRLAGERREAWHSARADLLFRLLDLKQDVSILDLGAWVDERYVVETDGAEDDGASSSIVEGRVSGQD